MTKRERKKLFAKVPSNLAFWYWTLTNPEKVKQFVERGDVKQHEHMIRVLNYLRRYEQDYFKQINGQEILRSLKADED